MMYEYIIAVVVLLLGWLIGEILARATKEELKSGKRWFEIIIISGIVGVLMSLYYKKLRC